MAASGSWPPIPDSHSYQTERRQLFFLRIPWPTNAAASPEPCSSLTQLNVPSFPRGMDLSRFAPLL